MGDGRGEGGSLVQVWLSLEQDISGPWFSLNDSMAVSLHPGHQYNPTGSFKNTHDWALHQPS